MSRLYTHSFVGVAVCGQSYKIHLDFGKIVAAVARSETELEFAEAICHVISQGNYRKELFELGVPRHLKRPFSRLVQSVAGYSMPR